MSYASIRPEKAQCRDKSFAMKKDINLNTKMGEINPQLRELA